MNRIEKRMEELQNKNEKAFVTYMTAGLPDMEGTKALIKAQAEAGIDIIELGIPFSDPTADGPVIQDASYRSICKGTNLKGVFAAVEEVRKDCLDCDKYGNDLDTADSMANELYEYVAKGVRNRGIEAGMQYFLIVLSNNQLNTEWGNQTAASPDGRLSEMYMNPANNPQGGADKSGPTAMLNSLAKFDAKYHAGSVQNMKFSPSMFNQNREFIKALMKTYFFRKGGCHLMVTVVDKKTLEDAVDHPEKYPNLIVRVSGFSAVFVNLTPEVQQELLSRATYDEERCRVS